MQEQNNLTITYYKNLIDKALKKEILYSVEDGCEGLHDCLYLDFSNSGHKVTVDDTTFFPGFIIFYDYITEKGDYISQKGEHIEEMYSFTSDGFGSGIYLSKTQDENKDMFNNIIKLLQLKGYRVS